MSRTARKPLPGFGVKGRLGKRGQLVRGVRERGLARILWTEDGQRKAASWPDTPEGRAEAKAFGEGVVERLKLLANGVSATPTIQPITVRELWKAYQLAEFDRLRPLTRRNYQARWQLFEAFFTPHRFAHELTREHLDAYRKSLKGSGYVPGQVKDHVEHVKRVYRWAVDRDLLAPTKVVTYSVRFARDEKRTKIAEYSRDEATRILAQFDPRNPRAWRSYVATVVLAFAGPRQRAALHLEWRDVDFAARTVRWRPELDKTGKDRTQPMPAIVWEAFLIAYGWRISAGYEGPFVFFRPAKRVLEGGYRTRRAVARAASVVDKPWGYQAYLRKLRLAETAAQVPYIPLRGAHGFRRLVVGDVLERTGNLVTAGQYVGDTDVRVLTESYVRERPEQLRHVADSFGTGIAGAAWGNGAGTGPAAVATNSHPNRTQATNDNAAPVGDAALTGDSTDA